MKRTPFYQKHKDLGAKLVEFGGFEMPVQYPKGIISEHKAVRDGAGGVFDVSHMGEFDVKGADALQFLQTLTTNDVSALVPGKAQYSSLPNPTGGLLDDLIVYMLEPDHYMVVVNAGTQDKDWAWFSDHAKNFNVTLRNDSDNMALLAVQGRNAIDTLQKLTSVSLKDIEYYHFVKGKLADVEMIISRTGYTGEPGFEIYFPSDAPVANAVWDKVFEAGSEYGIEPIGLGARDTLRLEMGYCLYGNDIDETTNPLEAGLGWITKLNKSPECLAFPAIKAKKEAGIDRKLVGFVIDEKGAIARHGYRIFDEAGYHIGDVTSGSISPSLQKSIGLGYVAIKFGSIGSEVHIQIREGKRVPARIVKPPFVKSEAKG